MDNQIGARGGGRDRDLWERPGIRVIARLSRVAGKQPATAVAEHHNAPRIGPSERQCISLQRGRDCTGWDRDFATAHRELRWLDVAEALRRLGADVHLEWRSIEHHRRARIVADDAHARAGIRFDLDPLRQNFALRLRQRASRIADTKTTVPNRAIAAS